MSPVERLGWYVMERGVDGPDFQRLKDEAVAFAASPETNATWLRALEGRIEALETSRLPSQIPRDGKHCPICGDAWDGWFSDDGVRWCAVHRALMAALRR